METRYICTLDSASQRKIASRLIAEGINGDDFQMAMESRLCDLADTISLKGVILA